MKFRPALLIGLGRHGSEIARRMTARIRERDALTAPLVGLLELDDTGVLRYGDVQRATISLAGAETYSARFSAVAAAEGEIEKAITDALSRLRRRDVLVPLREAGYDITDQSSIYFVAPLGDRLGSPALIDFLAIVKHLASNQLAGQKMHRTVLGFFPDLFPDQRDDEECYARTYVCLQELEFIGTPQSSLEPLAYDFISLFTARNEANEDLGSYEDVADVLGEAFSLALRQHIAVDESFAVALVAKTPEGMVTRYSSLGMARLVFPREEICRALHARFAADVLRDYGVLVEETYDRHVVSRDVRTFIFRDGLDRIEPQLGMDASGKPIWNEFSTKASFSEDAYVEETLATLREDADAYERRQLTAMTAETRETRSRLAAEHANNLATTLRELLDQKGPRYAHAFLDVFLNESSEYTTGDTIDDAVSADDIDRGARHFFDALFEIRRGDLSKLQQEINSKEAVLVQHETTRSAPGGEENAELLTTIETTQDELRTIQKKHGELDHKIKLHDLRLQDGAQRRQLLMQQRADMERKAREQAATIDPLDDDYRRKRRSFVHEEESYKERTRQLLTWAALLFVGIIVGAAIVRWLTGPVENFTTNATKVGVVLMVIYGVWAAIQWSQAKARVVQAHLAMTRAAHGKREALGVLRQLYDKTFRVTYDFARHGAAVDWATEFKESVKRLRESVQAFQTTLRDLFDRESAAVALPPPPSGLFTRSVAVKEDVDRLLSLSERYPHERARVRTVNDLSKVFTEFSGAGNLDVLAGEVDSAAAEVFAAVHTMTIEQFLLAADTPKRAKSTERVAQLFHFGEPLIQLRIEGSDDHLRNVTYFGSSAGEASSLVEIARKLGREPQVFRSDTEIEIVLVTTKVGFPAFHIALMAHCDHSLQGFPDPSNLKAVPEWPLPPLVPSVVELGTEDDPARQLACQSLALGIVVQGPEGMVFEEQVVGKNYRSLIESLRSTRGTGLTAKLQVRAKEAMAREDAADTLSGFLHHAQFDEIDQRIIQRILDRLEDGV
jgi:hypothetical protein